jgi:hypothetical protein
MFVRGGVQVSNVDKKVHYEEVKKSHYTEVTPNLEEPDTKKRFIFI